MRPTAFFSLTPRREDWSLREVKGSLRSVLAMLAAARLCVALGGP